MQLLLLLLLLRVLHSYTMIDHGYRFICGFIYWVYILYDTNYLHRAWVLHVDCREEGPVWFMIETVFMSGLHH